MPGLNIERIGSELNTSSTVSESNVKRRLLSDAAQHPLTTLSSGVAAISGIYLVLLSPVFGGNSVATAVLCISCVAALSNFAYRYLSGRSQAVSVLLEDEGKERIRQRDVAIRRRFGSLYSDLVALDHFQGTTALERLRDEYCRLTLFLADQSEIGILSVTQIEHLTNETYRRGLSVLADSVTLIEAIETPGIAEIATEITSLEIEIEELRASEERADRIAIKQNVLTAQRNRLNELEQLQVHVDELLYQSRKCEFSLNHTRIELAAIKAGSSDFGVNTVIGALEKTIQRAKEVQEELKGLGY